jgi:hypothetical protein
MPLGLTGKWPLEQYKGEDITHPFEVEASLTSDITGWTPVMTIKDKDLSPTFTTTINGVIIDGPNRLFDIVIPAITSEAMLVGVWIHDIWRMNAGFHWVLNDASYTVKTERRVQVP